MTTTLTVEGNVETFNRTGFILGLTTLFPDVDAESIELSVRAASVHVDVSMTITNPGVAESVVSVLSDATAIPLLSQALGVDVEGISPPTTAVVIIVRTDPPPPLSDASGYMTAIGLSWAILVVGFICLSALCAYSKRWSRLHAQRVVSDVSIAHSVMKRQSSKHWLSYTFQMSGRQLETVDEDESGREGWRGRGGRT